MSWDSVDQKAAALDFARPFDVHKWSDYPEVNKAVNALFDDLKGDPEFTGNDNLQKKHVKVVVLDLYAAWLADQDCYISLSRDANSYKRDSRYNRIKISFITVAVVDALKRSGYIEVQPGYYDSETKTGKQSRIRATDKLIALIKDEYKVPKAAIQKHPNTECIILRDSDKNDIAYTDTAETNRMRKKLKAYNDLLNRTKIEIPDPEDFYVLGIDREAKYLINEPGYFVRRIFNNSSWRDGGRFHGGWWQQIPGKIRRTIHLNDGKEGCSEVDYSGLHIVLLYGMEDIDYWKEDGEDPYKLAGYEESERLRQLLKIVLLIAINAKDKATAVNAIKKEINFNNHEYGWSKSVGIDIEELIDAFASRHQRIAKYLFSGQGIKLQHIDSRIAEKVIEHFTAKDIPVLCVHDSFLIDPLHENELITLMVKSFKEIVRNITPSKIDIEATMKHSCHYSDLLKVS